MEIGASGGLNLRWDRFRYILRDWTWGPPDAAVRLRENFVDAALPFAPTAAVEIAERTGCDRAPVDAGSANGRQRLLSFIWPDQLERFGLTSAACDVAASVPATVETADAITWLRRRLAEPRPGVASVVVHTVMLQYLTDRERAELDELLDAAGARADDDAPVARLSLEPYPDAALRVRLWPGGDERGLATATMHAREIRWRGSAEKRV